MSRVIKLRLSVSERKQRRELAKLAAEIPHDAALRTALEQCDPSERNAMVMTLAPHLSFLPSEEILACAVCGAFRGALRAHECVAPVVEEHITGILNSDVELYVFGEIV